MTHGRLDSDDRLARDLRGFGPVGLLAMLGILLGNGLFAPLSGLLVLVWARRSRTPWREIGYVRPRSWLASLALGMLFGGAFKLVMKALVMPLLGAPPVNPAYHFLAGNTPALPGMIVAIVAGAGFGEETVFRGYMFERLRKLIGNGSGATVAIVVITSALFAVVHYPGQGVAGVEQAAIVGLVFATVFARTGRLFPLMCAHAAFDLVALGLIYFDVERDVAEAIFRGS